MDVDSPNNTPISPNNSADNIYQGLDQKLQQVHMKRTEVGIGAKP